MAARRDKLSPHPPLSRNLSSLPEVLSRLSNRLFGRARTESKPSELDDLERRRKFLGKGKHKLKPDSFGGWRENWRVFYVGKGPS